MSGTTIITRSQSAIGHRRAPSEGLDRAMTNVIPPPTAASPWDATNHIDIQIHPGNKDIAAQQHRDKHFFTHANASHVCFYTDGTLLEGKAGAGIHTSVAGNTIHESSYYLETEAEVLDAELYGIMKATELATKISLDENLTDIWIFCDNQTAVRRMNDKRPLPGQDYSLKVHRNSEILSFRGIKTHIHWVPGQVNVKGNERADTLAKEGTKGKRLPRDATTSIT